VISDKAKKISAASAGKDDGVGEARSKLKELKVTRFTTHCCEEELTLCYLFPIPGETLGLAS